MRKPIMIWGAPSSVPEKENYEIAFKQSGNNFGNILIGNGVRSVIEPYPILDRSELSTPEEATERCSHVVIPAANWLWKDFDFGFMQSFLEKTQLPITIIGIGAQTNDRSMTAVIHPNTLRLMQIIAERSATIGVRGYYTAEVLATHGIHNTEVIGCPSLYTTRLPNLRIDIGRLNSESEIVVNFSRRVARHSFNPESMRLLENELLAYALKRNSTFVAQDEVEELAFSQSAVEMPKYVTDYFGKSDPEEIRLFLKNKTHWFYNVDAWSDFMRTKSISIGSRFHGNLVALISGVPALMIIHDSRTMEMASLLSIPSIHVSKDYGAIGVKDFFREKIQSLRYDQFEKTYAILYARYVNFLRCNGLPSNLPSPPS